LNDLAQSPEGYNTVLDKYNLPQLENLCHIIFGAPSFSKLPEQLQDDLRYTVTNRLQHPDNDTERVARLICSNIFLARIMIEEDEADRLQFLMAKNQKNGGGQTPAPGQTRIGYRHQTPIPAPARTPPLVDPVETQENQAPYDHRNVKIEDDQMDTT